MPETTTYLRFRRCAVCDVLWHVEDGENCWACDTPGTPTSGPAIGSQSGFATAMSDTGWAQVRAEIFADQP